METKNTPKPKIARKPRRIAKVLIAPGPRTVVGSRAPMIRPSATKNEAAKKFVEELLADTSNAAEQAAEWQEMKIRLDEDRLSSRKLFP